jgi:hypothetical protein
VLPPRVASIAMAAGMLLLASVPAAAATSQPTISLQPLNSPLEGASGQFNSVVYRIALSGRYIANVSVDVGTEDGSAWECLGSGLGCDYQQVRGTVSFIPGVVEKNIAVPVYGDNQAEADETLSLVLSNPVNGVIATSRVGSTIRDDD